MLIILCILAVIGVVLCLYGVKIERTVRKHGAGKLACDINDRASCSKAALSGYSRTLGISNTFWGLGYYVLLAVLAFFDLNQFILWFSIAALCASAYLAYILLTQVRTFCPVCISVYVLNIAIFFVSLFTF